MALKILVHTCCAPCLIHPRDVLEAAGFEVVPYFYNPNIHPFREYCERYFALLDYCGGASIDLKAGPYDMEQYLAEVVSDPDFGSEQQGARPSRCAVCYRVRLSRTAQEALRLGIGRFTSTLLVSPYQDQEQIRLAGEAAAIEHGVLFHFEDMTSGFRDGEDESRRLGLYRQSYCGCIFSEKERYQKGDPPRR